jgi:hypothetical protein
LTRKDCLERLVQGRIGRIALSLRSMPTILPVAYAVDVDRVVIGGATLAPVLDIVYRNVVTFQVDGFDARPEDGWSVSITGIAHPLGPPPGTHPPGHVGPPAAAIPLDLMQGIRLGAGWAVHPTPG